MRLETTDIKKSVHHPFYVINCHLLPHTLSRGGGGDSSRPFLQTQIHPLSLPIYMYIPPPPPPPTFVAGAVRERLASAALPDEAGL
jgi:hypothetical protein